MVHLPSGNICPDENAILLTRRAMSLLIFERNATHIKMASKDIACSVTRCHMIHCIFRQGIIEKVDSIL